MRAASSTSDAASWKRACLMSQFIGIRHSTSRYAYILRSDDHGDMLGCHEGAVVRHASQNILAWSLERSANLPFVIRRDGRRPPTRRPGRIRAVARILPSRELWRIERNLSSAAIL